MQPDIYVSKLEKFHQDDVEENGLFIFLYTIRGGKEIYDGFADDQTASQDHINFYAPCVDYEDKFFMTKAHGYRICLPIVLSISTFIRPIIIHNVIVLHSALYFANHKFFFFVVTSHSTQFDIALALKIYKDVIAQN